MKSGNVVAVSLLEALDSESDFTVLERDWRILSRADAALSRDDSWESRLSELQAPLCDLSPGAKRWAVRVLRNAIREAMLAEGYAAEVIEPTFALYGLKLLPRFMSGIRIPIIK